MLFGDIVLKITASFASIAGLTGIRDPEIMKQDPLDVLSGARSLTLSDRLTLQPSVSIFFSYARECDIMKLLEDGNDQITVFAPTNKAVMSLTRKPHEGPAPVDDTVISQEEFDSRSKANVKAWVSAHIVDGQGITEFKPPVIYDTMLPEVHVSVTQKLDDHVSEGKPDWENVLINEEIAIIDKVEASNGVIYLVDGALYG